jgi:serine/threonine protein kinase
VPGRTLNQAYEHQDEEVLLYWVFQISLALSYLREQGVVHRDLKPRNIMVNQQGLVKIVDFGVSKILHDGHSEIVGSPAYIAPEIIREKSLFAYFSCVGFASDIWSLGMTVYELIHK